MSDSKDGSKKDENSNDETKTSMPDSSGRNSESPIPNKIGQYLIKRVIASGGMGTVFEALQENPKRPVALKVIKSSLESESAVRRLEYEAQLLARLRHPGIAQIYEAGSYDDKGKQSPFFAMEYIPNAKSIIEYSDENKLSRTRRIELFLQVCDAIHHGHQRGIVHRDLKPSNILVDSSGRVRVIDFGVARATDADMKQAAGLTNYGQIVGTVQYMSPEQFDADPHDIDIRSDVYALGLILYELLTGKLPYRVNAEKIFEFASEVREGRTIPPSEQDRSLGGDFESIVQMAMHRDREHRYQSAYGLALDMRRYLNGDAVVATRPGLGYQVRVFARKNKMVIGLAGAVFVLLLTSVIVTSSLLVAVEREREQVQLESEKGRKANRFMASIFEQAIPVGFGTPVPISEMLEKSSKMLEDAFPDDPEIESDIMHSLGMGFFWCEEYDESIELLSRSLELRRDVLGLSDDTTKKILRNLNWVYSVVGAHREYLQNCTNICSIDSVNHGATAKNTLNSKLNVAYGLGKVGRNADALQVVQKTKQTFINEGYRDVKLQVDIDNSLAWFLLQNGQFDEAEEIAKANYDLASRKVEDNSYVKDSRSAYGAVLIAKGKLDAATELYGNFPTYPNLDKEYDFQGNFDPQESELHLVIFWEEWCPYCDRRMRNVETLYRQYHNLGIDIVGATRVNRTSTVAKCEKFIDRNNLTFPLFKEGGNMFDYFDGDGVPDSRLIYQGNLIWEHRVPSNQLVSRHMLEGIAAALSSR